MPYLRTSFSSATRRCISPCPHSTISRMSWLCVSEIEGSSSMSLARAAVSFTSSFFSLAAIASPNTGLADGGGLDLDLAALFLDQRFAGLDAVEAAEGDGVAGACLAAFGGLLAEQREEAGRRAPRPPPP